MAKVAQMNEAQLPNVALTQRVGRSRMIAGKFLTVLFKPISRTVTMYMDAKIK